MSKYLKSIAFVLASVFVFGLTVDASVLTLSEYFEGRLPTVEERMPLAESCGISPYAGTKEQNGDLLDCLLANDSYFDLLVSDDFFIPNEDGILGQGYNPVTGYQSRTTQYVDADDTTIPVVSTKDKAGNAIALTNISSSSTVKVYMNLEPGTSKEEPIVCTGVTASSWTSCTRGLAFQGTSESSSTTIATTHNAGAKIIITNISQFFNQFASLEGSQIINNVKTFMVYPEFINSTTATTSEQFTTKRYVDNVANQGAATSTESVGGISELATQIEMASSTNLGADNPLVLQARYATSTPGVRGLYVPIAENDGYLSQSWLDLSESFIFSGGVISQSSSTFTASTTFSGRVLNMRQITNNVTTTGAAIDGSTTPQAVAMSTTTGLIYQADGNNVSRVQFVGFITTNESSGASPYIQTGGLVTGFSGLTPGATYYVSDTAGSIASSPGTVTIPIGKAITATTILIDKGRKVAQGTISHSAAAGATQDITITPGFRYSVLLVRYEINGRADGADHPQAGTAILYGTTNAGSFGIESNDDSTALTSSNIDTLFQTDFISHTVLAGTDRSYGTWSVNSVSDDSFVSRWVNTIVGGSAGQTIAATINYVAIE